MGCLSGEVLDKLLMDSGHLPGVQHREVPPQSLSTRSLLPAPHGQVAPRGATGEFRHPPPVPQIVREHPLGFRAAPAAFQPCPWGSGPGRGGWPELRPPLAQTLQFLTHARGRRGHWALQSERVVSAEPEVRVSHPKAHASSQAWPPQRLRVAAPCPVASRSSSPSLTCSSSLSL